MSIPSSLSSWDNVQRKVSQSAVVSTHLLFSGILGHLAGHTINTCDRWLHPVKNALGKPPLVNPFHGLICGVIFAGVDRLARFAFQRYLPEHITDKPITHTTRIMVSITVSTLITSSLLPISMSMAVALLVTNVLATTLLVSIANNYTHLVYPGANKGQPNKGTADPEGDRLLGNGAVKESFSKNGEAVLLRA